MQRFSLEHENSSLYQRIQHLYYEHILAASLGWQRLFRQRYQTIGAILLIGLTLSVCLIFGFALRLTTNFQTQLEQTSSLTLFPQTTLSAEDYSKLIQRLNSYPNIQEIKVYSAGDLIEELLDKSIVKSFWENTPGIITASTPKELTIKQIIELKNQLELESGLVAVEFDQLWHSKILELIQFVHLLSWVIGIVLISSVVLVINYSIKLLMEKYKQEISIMYHLGASWHFIQRPYLYQGFFLGFFGALFAPLCVGVPLFLLRDKIFSVIELFQLSIPITHQDILFLSYILLGVISFAWLCSYSSTRKWLRIFEGELV